MLESGPLVRVVTSAEATARDRAAIDAGVPSRALMQRAGAATASEIALRFHDRLNSGVLVYAGPGNNGGDAWVVARALAASGIRVRVAEVVPAATPDARAERALAVPFIERATHGESLDGGSPGRGERLVIDGMLGTGSSGAPRDEIGRALAGIRPMRERGVAVVALDIPTGVDATTGQVHVGARADVTFTYGTLKRGHLIARAACGRIVVLDIGLGAHAELDDGAPWMVSGSWVARRVPDIRVDAHKGSRKKLAIVGGGDGMSGAPILAARAAWHSGVGMVKLVVSRESLDAARRSEPRSLTAAWPASEADVERDIARWADVVAIGPGLGAGGEARELVERVLHGFGGPVVLDADAINIFSSDVNALAKLLKGRPAVLTPHPMEFGRLTGTGVDEVLARRFEVALPLAKHTQAVVLLKGQPTIVTSPGGQRWVSASGTPLLAAAGSGDLLTGMVGTLLAQMGDPHAAAACATWVHGRAAWLVHRDGSSPRGWTLDDVIARLPRAWAVRARHSRYPVLLELPDLASRRR